MRKKNTVLIIGITSILILILVQVYIITGVWKEKNEMFSLRYSQLSQEASGYIRWASSPSVGGLNDDGFDLVRELLNDTTEKIVIKFSQLTDKKDLDNQKKGLLEYSNAVLQREQVLSTLLAKYFEMRGFEKNFNHRIIITNYELQNTDTIIIFRNEKFLPRGSARRRQPLSESTEPVSMSNAGSEILVGRYRLGGNHYRLDFDYFIDFSDKKQLILKETSASLGLSTFSILIVGIMFMITYRNLAEERRLSNLKTDFINNMTHELKTPLSTITVAGKTLEMPQIRSNDEKILETAKLIGKQSVHLNQLINMILEISMWERTQFELEKKKVDVEEVMKDIIDSFKAGPGRLAVINQKYNLEGTKTDLDVVYFTTLLNNLLSNAVKYSDKEPVIDIEGFTHDNNICIKVSDNGIGISRMDQKHVFDKFYRASTGNIHKYKGLGLGLYYVKKIAEAHGGDVQVSSKPGKGSTFTVIIPES